VIGAAFAIASFSMVMDSTATELKICIAIFVAAKMFNEGVKIVRSKPPTDDELTSERDNPIC
jgi:hypothetical protein